ncbi:hypothetical protein HanPI659440_Chr12g0477781 [Helianthus annuus]|nr:hypothetical protein HanIR_Chr12g0606631 [Helianthus annuus]KAJ0676475.1 hypothetical protein HanLR1_Chr12g0463221 [Helianthus annuus]KAJ0679685.1 hypothetical protein HanOQP8_Chr12g0462431 [Helianthus annuus]KAJ0727079.1 hypothetical protein HanPI659440_Chr12g0477781 [Helianthus annuus]
MNLKCTLFGEIRVSFIFHSLFVLSHGFGDHGNKADSVSRLCQGYSTDEVMMFFQQGDHYWLQNQLKPMNYFHVSMHSVFNSRKSECILLFWSATCLFP